MLEVELVAGDDPILHKPTSLFVFGGQTDPYELKIRMVKKMLECNGVGLAANQVGIDARIFVMGDPETNIMCINPTYAKRSDTDVEVNEGCLSFPGERIVTSRKDEVSIIYKDEFGVEHLRRFSGIWALCVQHEMDHLDGITFHKRQSSGTP